MAKKFRHKCDIHEAWAAGKEEILREDFSGMRLNDLKVSNKFLLIPRNQSRVILWNPLKQVGALCRQSKGNCMNTIVHRRNVLEELFYKCKNSITVCSIIDGLISIE